MSATTASGGCDVPEPPAEVWRALAVLEPYCSVCDVSYVLSQESGTWAEAAMIPARNSAREDPSYTEAPQSVLDPYLPNFHFLPSVPGVADTIAQTVEVAVNEAILGKSSVQEALSKYQENATTLLQQNKEKFGS